MDLTTKTEIHLKQSIVYGVRDVCSQNELQRVLGIEIKEDVKDGVRFRRFNRSYVRLIKLNKCLFKLV